MFQTEAEAKEFFQNMAANPEPLHPDLAQYLENHSIWGQVLRHPLVFAVPHTEAWNGMYNKQYEAKKKDIEESVARKDWSRYIFMHERPYRAQAFMVIARNLTDVEYWDLLGNVWTDSENIWQSYPLFKKLLRSNRPHKDKLMDDDECKTLCRLPEEVRVFRGHMGKNKRGLSWSLSSHAAGWFAQRFEQKGNGIITGLVFKDKIQALLLGRREFEVITDPKDVREQKPFSWVHQDSDPFKNVFHTNWGQAPLNGGGRTAHGIRHWHKVDHNGIILAGLTPGADLEVVRLFAAFHDSQRVNENHDPEHGERAAQYLQRQVKNGAISLKKKQAEKLAFACGYHEKGQVSEDPTIGVCWDADRLDLVRVGILPEAKLLSTQAGKNLICKI